MRPDDCFNEAADMALYEAEHAASADARDIARRLAKLYRRRAMNLAALHPRESISEATGRYVALDTQRGTWVKAPWWRRFWG